MISGSTESDSPESLTSRPRRNARAHGPASSTIRATTDGAARVAITSWHSPTQA